MEPGAGEDGRSRLRRYWQEQPSSPDILSTARSFAPPVGSFIEPQGVRGYPIDFSAKAELPEWPPDWLAPRERQLHVATAQWALGAYERHLKGERGSWLEATLAAADYLLGEQDSDGGWAHLSPMPHTYHLAAPWLSAMAQGEGASVLVRAHLETGDERYAEAARLALAPMRVPSSRGGTAAELGGGFFPEEYPTDPPSYVLNGAIFALWGCLDVANGLGDAEARNLYAEGIETLSANIDRFDTGFWSLYDLFPHPIRNIASSAYHTLHITQLEAMGALDPRPELDAAAERFRAYRDSGPATTRAMTRKVAFRLAVPRNERLALKLPWSHGPQQSESLVLCYHAVSDEWPSRLAVSADDLRAQVSHLLERGYRGATFSEAVRAPSGKLLAVTFDDGYLSMLTRAMPVLAELGVPGTVFVPTWFVGSDEPMAWPGIEQWLDTEYEHELVPLSWAQLDTLHEAGWEIGSHTRTHPKLTGLDDSTLLAELRESRVEIEDRLGRPCPTVAYPYGDVDDRVVAAAREAGYAAGAALPTRFTESRPLEWPRIGVYRIDSGRRFTLKVSPTVRRLRSQRAWEPLARVYRHRSRAADANPPVGP